MVGEKLTCGLEIEVHKIRKKIERENTNTILRKNEEEQNVI